MSAVRCLAVAAVLVAGAGARADQVFLPEAQAAVAIFGAGATAERETLQLSVAELAELSQALGKQVEKADYPVLRVRGPSAGAAPGPVLGAIFLLDVVGQSLPIGFAVGVKPDGSLQDIQVTVYREPYGKEIEEHRFRAQFRGKTGRDPLVVGKDIEAISGATISSGSAAYAARKALALWPLLQRRPGPK